MEINQEDYYTIVIVENCDTMFGEPHEDYIMNYREDLFRKSKILN